MHDSDEDNKYIADAAAQIPVIILNASFSAPNVYSVLSDDYVSMYDATSQIIADGITDLLYFYSSTSYSAKKKLAGFNNSMSVHCCTPELTSIDNRLEILCQHLITTLMGVLGGNEMPKKTVFSGDLIKRGTTLTKAK